MRLTRSTLVAAHGAPEGGRLPAQELLASRRLLSSRRRNPDRIVVCSGLARP